MTTVQLYETASSVANPLGNVILQFPGPGFGRTWQGTVSVLGSPQGTEWNVSIGAQAFGTINAPGPGGPYQLFAGQSITLSAAGLTAGSQYSAILSGGDYSKDDAPPYGGPTIVNSVVAGVIPPVVGLVFNIVAYGATGNGTIDDNAAIVLADAAAASTGGIVYYPPGTYRTSQPIIPSVGVTHAGAGMYASIVTVLPADFGNFAYNFVFNCTNANVTINDLGIDGQKRNGSNPANECGGLTLGPNTVVNRVRFDDINYFGLWLSPAVANLCRVTDCRSARSGNNDLIGGGNANDVLILRHRWENTAVGNRFDNVNGTNIVLDSCEDYSTQSGGFYFEGMVRSGARNCFFTQAGLVIQGDTAYAPPTPTNPLECFAIGNRMINANGIMLSYEQTGNKGGYNTIAFNTIDSSPGPGIVHQYLPAVPSTVCYGGDLILGNVIRSPNASNTSLNNGDATAANCAINLVQSYDVLCADNVCIDDRGIHLMGYAIQLGGGYAGFALNCIVRNNNCGGSVSTYLGTGDIATQGSATGCVIADNVVPLGLALNTAPLRASENIGYNPLGVVVVGVPATTVAVPVQPYDRTFYITTRAAVSVVISGGPSISLPTVGLTTIHLPATKTLTPTYSSTAPTWVVEAL